MSIYEQMRFLVGSESRVALLQALNSEPTTKDGLTDMVSVSEKTIARYLTTFVNFEWVEEIQEGYVITSAGRVVLREYEKALDEIDREELEFLLGGKEVIRPLLLRALAEPATRPELVEQCQVSETTAYRAVTKEGGFEDREWVLKRSDSQYILISNGEDVLNVHDELFRALEVVEENSVILENFETDPAPPIFVLEHASAESSKLEVAHKGLERCLDIIRSRPTRIRGTARAVSTPFVTLGRRLLERGIEMEIVLDEKTAITYQEQYPDDFERSVEVPNVDLYLHPEKFGSQLAIFDDERVLLGVYDDHGNLIGGIEGTDDDLITWAVELFERYRDEARLTVEPTLPEK